MESTWSTMQWFSRHALACQRDHSNIRGNIFTSRVATVHDGIHH